MTQSRGSLVTGKMFVKTKLGFVGK